MSKTSILPFFPREDFEVANNFTLAHLLGEVRSLSWYNKLMEAEGEQAAEDLIQEFSTRYIVQMHLITARTY